MNLQQLLESLLSIEPDLATIIPSSIISLKDDMFVKAKFYKGDLLMTVLAIEKEFWKSNSVLWQEIIEILENQSDKIKNEKVSFEMKVDWYEKINNFKELV